MADLPPLAPGVELLGALQDTGYTEPRFLVRLADGGMVGITRLTYAVATQVDGRRTYEEIAERAGADLGRRMSPDDARFLVRERLRPARVVVGAPAADVRPAAAVMSLMARAAIVPAGPVRAAASALRHLFAPVVVVAVLTAWIALDVWLVAIHGVGGPFEATVGQPAHMLAVLGLLACCPGAGRPSARAASRVAPRRSCGAGPSLRSSPSAPSSRC
jgi:putative peptide zinc metalloprotease protein